MIKQLARISTTLLIVGIALGLTACAPKPPRSMWTCYSNDDNGGQWSWSSNRHDIASSRAQEACREASYTARCNVYCVSPAQANRQSRLATGFRF